uniref:Uncharacterized protein n=1 Tax=Pithovirus LCDPAC02 TaxID=2506601 RepID=A0A481YPU8_9VIRU|nr:MAG: hypothetical protein LCDPAC02_01560 [Pithovirus LCDPAC02]
MEDVHYDDIWIDCEKYITIRNYKFKIYDYGLFKRNNESEIQITIWYISENCKLGSYNINILYFNKEHNIEIAIELFDQTFERFNNTEEFIDEFHPDFLKIINELIEFPEHEDLLFEYIIKTFDAYIISTQNIESYIPYKYLKYISRIENFINEFKKTEEYKIYIEDIKIDLVNRIYNDLTIHCGYFIGNFLGEICKHMTRNLNKNRDYSYYTYYYSKSHPGKCLKEILDTINIDCPKICLPDNTYYKIDFDSCEIPSFKNFVFKKNNLEITLINYLSF